MFYKGQELKEHTGRADKRFIDLTGKQIEDWFVICRAPNHVTKGKTTITEFWCECSCGKIQKVRSIRLRGKKNNKCKRCATTEASIKKAKFYYDIPMDTWKKIIIAANIRNLEFNITIESAWDLFLKQNRKCALTGVDLEFCVSQTYYGRSKSRWVHTASLDRVNNNLGYTKDNIQWVHKDINFMKQDYTESYCYEMWKKYVYEYENKQKLLDNSNSIDYII